MTSLPMKALKPGLVSLPGGTPASEALVTQLLHEDCVAHHCFFNDEHFVNHLSHHILSLHDLGAPAETIQAMHDQDAAIQRPLHPNGKPGKETNRITEVNWTGSLGTAHADMYPDYLTFFSAEILKHGVSGALERYIFSPEANGNGSLMLARFVGGLLHPIIQTGFGIEFGQDFMVAQGLAQAAVTSSELASLMDMPSGVPEIKVGPPTTLLSLLREVYQSPNLAPPPYEKDGINPERLAKWMASSPERSVAIREVYAKWTFNVHDDAAPEDFAKKIEECMWQATLLLGATGKSGRKPRMDFILMHFLTCSLFLRVIVDAMKKPIHKAQLLQAYVRSVALFVILRGRPRIDSSLAMSYPAVPVPPGVTTDSTVTALGKLGGGSPWLPILNNATLHSEPHVIKAIRMLLYCAKQYGKTPAGTVIGAVDASGNETHTGVATVDGTLFIRVAGVLMDGLGWVANGEKERLWDFSGIGWEEAWSKPDY
ncbi:hypothetical protein DFH09DRAFT_228844 [Mycena vulgaris]|nr:hypothetical protein DFH09DRAFT_228844 [Mycena vulgaris]